MHSSIYILISFLCLVAWCYGYTTFETTCSTPSISVNFVSSPDSRGTLNILWSCLATLLVCTWTIQHLNVPKHRTFPGAVHSPWYDFQGKLKRLWTNVKWMLFTLLAPEYILGKALGHRVVAECCKKRFKTVGINLTLTHVFYANMGGFVLTEQWPAFLSAQNIYRLRGIPCIKARISNIKTEELWD
jgi:hypothetical protein